MGETADLLVKNLSKRKIDIPLTHLSGTHTRGGIAKRLSDIGLNTINVAVYDQLLCALNKKACDVLATNFPLVLPLFSPRTAQCFAAQYRWQAQLHIVALSNEVANQVRELDWVTLVVPEHPTRKAMVDMVQKVANQVALG